MSRLHKCIHGTVSIFACAMLLYGPNMAYAAETSARKTAKDSDLSLKLIYEESWLRQPEAKAFTARLESFQAKERVSQSFTPKPPTLEVGGKGERTSNNGGFGAGGAGEYIVGLAIPLWLIGERTGAMALSDAESRRLIKQQASIQLKLAAQVRTLFWENELARLDETLAQSRYNHAKALSQDVGKRFKAGDLSRADMFQAESATANAEGALAEAKANRVLATQNLKAVVGRDLPSTRNNELNAIGEPLPTLPKNFSDLDQSHPMIQDLIAQVEVATKATELARVQTRQNPELQLYNTGGRPEVGVPMQQTLMLGIKIPFGSEARVQAQSMANKANQIEAEERLSYERQRILADLDTAKARVEGAKIRVEAARKRAKLTSETRGFFDKSFKFGETDLPTRLRVEQEAVDAAKQAAQAEVAYLASISALRQALGLLPE